MLALTTDSLCGPSFSLDPSFIPNPNMYSTYDGEGGSNGRHSGRLVFHAAIERGPGPPSLSPCQPPIVRKSRNCACRLIYKSLLARFFPFSVQLRLLNRGRAGAGGGHRLSFLFWLRRELVMLLPNVADTKPSQSPAAERERQRERGGERKASMARIDNAAPRREGREGKGGRRAARL